MSCQVAASGLATKKSYKHDSLRDCLTSKNKLILFETAELKACIWKAVFKLARKISEHPTASSFQLEKLQAFWFGWNLNWILVNQTEPEWPSDTRMPTNPQNKFVDTVSVFSYIRSTQYDETHRWAAQTMPLNGICVKLLVQIIGPVTTPVQ